MFRIKVKRFFGIGVCALLAASLGACVTPDSNVNTGKNVASTVYRPKLPPGIQTVDAAIRDLSGLLENQNYRFMVLFDQAYYTMNNLQEYLTPAGAQELVKGAAPGAESSRNTITNELLSIKTHTIFIRDDMLEVSSRICVPYADLIDIPIFVDQVGFLHLDQIWIRDLRDAQRVADDLFFIQQNYQRHAKEQMRLFESQAAQYRALKVKPPVSEDQRRQVVLANAFTQKKEYAMAINMYRKAVEMDPVSYPDAYYNLALLSEQLRRIRPAISYMKKYLALAPDARDARSAQDKIYEWEFLAPTREEVTTKVTTEPPDAFMELNVSGSGKKWAFVGRAPQSVHFWRTDPNLKYCLLRASKPGYHTEEKSFPFESLPAEVNIPLRKSGSGEDSYGWIGISFHEVTEEIAKSSGLATPKGWFVKELDKDGPADQAGLKPGDIILTCDGKEMNEPIDLVWAAASTPVGKTVDLGILRNGRTQTLRLKVGKRPE